MAQLVEHNLAKVGVAGSSPVFRSMLSQEPASQSALLLKARGMATWPSGKAEACKAFITGSIPVVASKYPQRPFGRFFIAIKDGPGIARPVSDFFGGPTRIRTWNLSIMSRSR